MRSPLRWVGAICLLIIARGTARAEVYRHDLFGVSLRVPSDFSGSPDLSRSRSDVLSAWTGSIGTAFAVLIVEHVDAAQSGTADDLVAKRIVDSSLIDAHCDQIEREKVRWHGRTLGVIVGFVRGDVDREAHAVVDVPLVGGGALRISLSAAAAQRAALSRTLRTLVSSVKVRKPSR